MPDMPTGPGSFQATVTAIREALAAEEENHSSTDEGVPPRPPHGSDEARPDDSSYDWDEPSNRFNQFFFNYGR